MKRTTAAIAACLLMSPAGIVFADSASEFGRAQSDKNSYEANREWRERNIKPIQIGPVPSLPTPDNSPRSSAEINAEFEIKMEAMHARWATKPLSENEQAALQEKRNRQDAEESRIRWGKTYPRMLKKARKAVLQDDAKWDKFLGSLTYEESGMLKEENSYTFHSPLADFGREIFSGNGKTPPDVELAKMVWTRGEKYGDRWSSYNLALLDAATGTSEGLQKAFSTFNSCRPYPNPAAGVRDRGIAVCAVETSRAHAFGLGVPVDTYLAERDLYIASSDGYYDQKSPPYPTESWMQYQLLQATYFLTGTIHSRNADEAKAILANVAKNPGVPLPWRAHLALLQAGGDLDDKALSWRLLNDASAAGRREADGYIAVKLMKGEGVPADLEGGYSLAMALPGMPPQATAHAARLLMASSPAKAAALIERHALKEDEELQLLLAEARQKMDAAGTATVQ